MTLLKEHQTNIYSNSRPKFTILLAMLLGIGINLHAQQTLSLKASNVTVKEALSKIEENSDYVFFYSDGINSELAKRVSINAQNQTITEVLDQVLASVNVSYSINKKQISLFPQNKIRKQAVETTMRVSGTITDNIGEPLIGVSVKLQGTGTGVITDIDGFFSIDSHQGDVLEISYVGFETQHIKVGS